MASLVLLRAELVQVPYLNDSAVHEEMVRFALALIRTGRFPPASWFPFLNLGSPQYLHYQPLGAMVTALLAWPVGVGRAFTLTTWLLVCCWPACVYASGRIFGLSPGAAAAAAVLSPFVSSFTRVGYEQISYLWSGYGVWSQLWAMWTLPLAWAFSFRAAEDRRYLTPAAVLVAATVAFHFETGYLAVAGLAAAVLARPVAGPDRVGRVAGAAVGAFALCGWVVVPLVAQGKWAAVNQLLRGGPDANSYGAKRVLSSLFGGNLLDWHHAPVITPLFLLGLIACLVVWWNPREAVPLETTAARTLTLLFLVSLLLFFGRPTLGHVLDALPGAHDLFLRRFIVGVQLAALFLAGVGAACVGRLTAAAARRWASGGHQGGVARLVGWVVPAVLASAALVPGWSFVTAQAERNASFVAQQEAARPEQHELNGLLSKVRRMGGGRVYAGDPSNWGSQLKVGEVPVFKYLAADDVAEVGFTLRTASLMSNPEAYFDDDAAGDYAAFGIRWLLLPKGAPPPIAASRTASAGPYALWEVRRPQYVEVVDSRGSISSNSGDLGSFAASFLSSLPAIGAVFPTMSYDGASAAPGTLPPDSRPTGHPGRVLVTHSAFEDGTVTAKVSLLRPSVVLLSSSFDPGWQATVDGRRRQIEMLAPALVGVRLDAGIHTVVFRYVGFPDYPQLGLLAVAGFVALLLLGGGQRRRGRRRNRATARVEGE